MSATKQSAESKDGIWETVKVIVEALLLALVVRTFLFQPFSIPSGSMMHTLLIGDYLFVSKYSYGYSKYSFPFGLAPFEGRIWASAPKAGDIVVFKLPADHSTDYIKRVIGLPGDKVQMKGGVLYINEQPVKREHTGEFVEKGPFGNDIKAQIWRETLPNGVSYDTLDMGTTAGDDTREFEVPPGHYFMMGDNRDNSADSRIDGSGVGYVPFDHLVGKAQVIFFSIDESAKPWMFWTWPWTVRVDRMLSMLN
ncbi:signal peptidase I [Pleomorphomonas oryzae]|uniref:signal peptidase I n=1 Tax=Pleomorphomonas oryzae TaxID=261934 RepID=UPI0003F8FAAF|nr:signal peptidase I [Pleomorphomonas oryzae]